MAIDDETTLAFTAARDLAALCAAYRAASLAHIQILRRLDEVAARDEHLDPVERLETHARYARRAATARETDAVFALRAAQLNRRMLELRELQEPA